MRAFTRQSPFAHSIRAVLRQLHQSNRPQPWYSSLHAAAAHTATSANAAVSRGTGNRGFGRCCYGRGFAVVSSSLLSPADRNNMDDVYGVRRLRNIGIVAHVDAGKTTTTEGLLLHTGVISRRGGVDEGDTVTDYLPMERERGITIQSAAVTMPHRGYQINLIDTPGHVDFTVEVERAVRVIDGSVAIVDAVAGVQAQTETVWLQTERYGVSRVAFVNKMDRPGASLERCLESMKRRLSGDIAFIPIQLPLGSGESFRGIVDLLSGNVFDHGEFVWRGNPSGLPLPQPTAVHISDYVSADGLLLKRVAQGRQELLEALASVDDEFMEFMLEHDTDSRALNEAEFPLQAVQAAVRRSCLRRKCVPVLCGSSLRDIGVPAVLDAVVDFLPSPAEILPAPCHLVSSKMLDKLVKAAEGKPKDSNSPFGQCLVNPSKSGRLRADLESSAVALAFKVAHDVHRGMIVYFRVYAGEVVQGLPLLNVLRGGKERPLGLFRITGGDLEPVESVTVGNIGAAVGLREASTGDTLVPAQIHHRSFALDLENGQVPLADDVPLLEGITPPQPVFFCSIEPDSTKDEAQLMEALELLKREDPSFFVRKDDDTGQVLLAGQGELHLDILYDRLLNHYDVKASRGSVQVAYKATPTHEITEEHSSTYEQGSKRVTAFVRLRVVPAERGAGNSFDGSPADMEHAGVTDVRGKAAKSAPGISHEVALRSVQAGIEDAWISGVYGNGVEDCAVFVDDLSTGTDTSEMALRRCASQLLTRMMLANSELLEPLMRVEIVCDEKDVGVLVSDLSGPRRGSIIEISRGEDTSSSMDARTVILCEVPLASLVGYSSAVRSQTRGSATLTMEFSRYGDMDKQVQTTVWRQLRGF